MNQKKWIILTSFLVFALIIAYAFSLKSQLQEQMTLANNYKKQVNSLSKIVPEDAQKVNEQFINKFFNYSDISTRYKDIQSLMTDKGYQSTHPSGAKVPDRSQTVKSSISDLKSFKYSKDKSNIEFINEFSLTTDFNGVSNTKITFIKTVLVYVEGSGWKIDNLEFIK